MLLLKEREESQNKTKLLTVVKTINVTAFTTTVYKEKKIEKETKKYKHRQQKLSISNWKNTVCSKQQLKLTQGAEINKKTCETDQKLTEIGRRSWRKKWRRVQLAKYRPEEANSPGCTQPPVSDVM